MNLTRSGQVLLDVCELVDSELAAHPMEFPGSSVLAQEIDELDGPEKREFLQSYLSESLMALLLGVLDQARSIALISYAPPAAVAPLILMRSLFEYSQRIVYLADESIKLEERIGRTLRLYYVDLVEYKRLPEAVRPQGSTASLEESTMKAVAWYKELTGEKLNSIRAQEILDTVWRTGLDYLEEDSDAPNDGYQIGYRIGSALTHGNVWAIRNHCLAITREQNGFGIGFQIRESLLSDLHLLAASIVMLSFGFVAQYAPALAGSTMNKIEEMLSELR